MTLPERHNRPRADDTRMIEICSFLGPTAHPVRGRGREVQPGPASGATCRVYSTVTDLARLRG
jgi:hypothetical protein